MYNFAEEIPNEKVRYFYFHFSSVSVVVSVVEIGVQLILIGHAPAIYYMLQQNILLEAGHLGDCSCGYPLTLSYPLPLAKELKTRFLTSFYDM